MGRKVGRKEGGKEGGWKCTTTDIGDSCLGYCLMKSGKEGGRRWEGGRKEAGRRGRKEGWKEDGKVGRREVKYNRERCFRSWLPSYEERKGGRKTNKR